MFSSFSAGEGEGLSAMVVLMLNSCSNWCYESRVNCGVCVKRMRVGDEGQSLIVRSQFLLQGAENNQVGKLS